MGRKIPGAMMGGGLVIKPVTTLPADGSQSPLVLYNGAVLQWKDGKWVYTDVLTINGEAVTINDSAISGIPYGTAIELNEDGSVSLTEDSKIAVGV